MALTAIPGAGAKLRGSTLAALFNERLPLTAYKTADESVTSSAVSQDDDALSLAVVANAVYLVTAWMIYEATTASDIRWGFTWPTGATMPWGEMALDTAAAGIFGDVKPNAFGAPASGDVFQAGGAGAGSQLTGILYGLLTTSSTAGTLQLQWAQGTSGATATKVKAGSVLEARRLA